jgi:hypothetical protein
MTHVQHLGNAIACTHEDLPNVTRHRGGRRYVVLGTARLHEAVKPAITDNVEWARVLAHPSHNLGSGSNQDGEN